MRQSDPFIKPQMTLRLFVYGTLKHGFHNHEKYCKGVLAVEEAAVKGRLYHLPSGIPVLDVPASDIIAYGSDDVAHDLLIQNKGAVQPGLICHNIGWSAIQGELMTFDDPERLCDIDTLEGFAPNRLCLYRRVLLPAYRQDGSVVAAWCYVLGKRSMHLQVTHNLDWRGL